ncbi:MAG TPA: YCF48-related protein, partial [Burkholderiaceae bacterium]|nr:YCF48-related protein [Burkholderiaceae bacterium]
PFFDLAFGNGRGLLVGAYGLAFETLDEGRSWHSIAHRLPNPKGLHLYGVGFTGGRVYVAGEQGLLLRSNDGGERYEALASPYKGSYFGLVAARSGTLVVYGLRGNAFRSTDGGANWSPIRTGTPVGLGAGIERADRSIVLLAQNGDLLVSRDDGASFARRPAAEPFPASGLAPADEQAVIVAGLRGLARMDAA